MVGKPTIYFLIDRWSRFVVSAYISLRAPSYEEVRNTLLIAFTSREKRFSRLGIEVSDNQWPIGCIPAVICPDRGSDFMSGSMLQSVVDDLRIDLTPLPSMPRRQSNSREANPHYQAAHGGIGDERCLRRPSLRSSIKKGRT